MNAEQIISTELDLADFDPVAFEEGQEAFDNGEAETANPYRSGSTSNRAWKAGWGVALSASTRGDSPYKESDLEEYHRRIGEVFLAGGQTP